MIDNETLATGISTSVIGFVVVVYLALTMTIAELPHSPVADACTQGCPMRSSSARRAEGLSEGLYSDGRLVETRLRFPDQGHAQICELTYSFGSEETPVARSYIVTY